MQDVSELNSRTTFARSKPSLVDFVKDRLIDLATAKHLEYYFTHCSIPHDWEYHRTQFRRNEVGNVIDSMHKCGYDATVITQLRNLIDEKETINQVMSAYLSEYVGDTLTILNAFER